MAIPTCDFAVIGAGMAGASLAAELTLAGARVVLVESEPAPGYHATGRSAAFWTESYGGPGVQPLTAASGPFLREHGFLTPRGALTIARSGQAAALERFAERFATLGVQMELLDRNGVAGRVPGLRPEWNAGVLEQSCCDIDVAALHHHYLAEAGRGGAQMLYGAGLTGAAVGADGWRLTLRDGLEMAVDRLVNAAGAWADDIARLAGVRPIGITPLRRTMAQVRCTPDPPPRLPLVLDLGEQFYFKPDNGRLWLSPHDETPSPPCDVAPDEVDVATAIARLETVVDWRVERVEHRWAGLRSFAPDRLPVYGSDPREPRFIWFAGQGGFGIQTAPAAARLAAGVLVGGGDGAVDPAPYRAGRFA